MFVGGVPGRYELVSRSAVSGDTGRILRQKMTEFELDSREMYYTFAVKYGLGSNKLKSSDIKMCKPYLMAEIDKVKPEIIVCMGKDALEAVCDKTYKFSVVRGTPVPYPMPDTNIIVYAIFNPAFLDIAPREYESFNKDMSHLKQVLDRSQATLDPYMSNIAVINNADAIAKLRLSIAKKASIDGRVPIAIDCEWHGRAWYDINRKLRTVQLGLQGGAAFVLEFWTSVETSDGYSMVQAMDDPEKAWRELKLLLEGNSVQLIGHNIKEDGLFLMQQGIDIRPTTLWDTMLAESLLNQAGPFGLEELALKYTKIPRWALALERWKSEVGGKWHKGGYGFIPPSILNPYAALDVIATMAVFEAQLPLMKPYLAKRGKYPSLFQNIIQTQNNIYEVELTGLPVDTEMLDKMIALFEPKVDKLKLGLVASALELGMDGFNPDSGKMVQELLFKRLKITPFKTTKATGGKLWHDAIKDLSIDDDDPDVAAATDALSLTILADAHPIVSQLLDYRRVAQIRKTWLRTPDENGEGGLYGVMTPEFKLAPSFSMLTETGRCRTSRPNSQNFPKKAQKFLKDIFEDELKSDPWLMELGNVPSVRQIVRPPDGWVFIEGDFVQAELFTMAELSGDQNMLKTLKTPGKDLHDKTTIDGFGIKVHGADGHIVDEDEILTRAMAVFLECKGGTPDFDKRKYEKGIDAIMSPLIYIDQAGKSMTRKQFKNSARVAGKSINFGIPYGRGGDSIAIQIKSETNSKEPLSSIAAMVHGMLATWKTVSYPVAWAYMEECSRKASQDWIVTNPWGRSRRFNPTSNRKLLSGYGRQGSNFPIQSTVADTCNIALQMMVEARAERGLTFKICNLVHDAIMGWCRIEEIEDTCQLFRDTMGSVDIPLGGGRSFRLSIDLDVMSRWGVEYKGGQK